MQGSSSKHYFSGDMLVFQGSKCWLLFSDQRLVCFLEQNLWQETKVLFFLKPKTLCMLSGEQHFEVSPAWTPKHIFSSDSEKFSCTTSLILCTFVRQNCVKAALFSELLWLYFLTTNVRYAVCSPAIKMQSAWKGMCIPRFHSARTGGPGGLEDLLSSWWFRIFFFSSRKLETSSNLTNIFQMDWNHQLVFLHANWWI